MVRMKGLVFNVAEEVVTDNYGADVWDSLLDSANVDGAYTSLGNYDDEEILAIVTAAASLLEETVDETWRILGRKMLPLFASRIEETIAEFDGAESLLRAVNSIIHPNVKVLYPDAAPPIFEFKDTDSGLLVRYISARGLAALAEGLIIGCGDFYNEVVDLERLDPDSPNDCRFIVSFPKARHYST